MTDGGLSLLTSITIILVVIGFIIILLVIFTPQKGPDILEPTCISQMINTLTDLSDYPCVVENQIVTSKRFTSPSTRTLVASASQTPYKQACATICNSISANGVCIGTSNQITNYNECIRQLTPPVGCNISANPIGKVGATPYYMETYYSPGTNPKTDTCIY